MACLCIDFGILTVSALQFLASEGSQENVWTTEAVAFCNFASCTLCFGFLGTHLHLFCVLITFTKLIYVNHMWAKKLKIFYMASVPDVLKWGVSQLAMSRQLASREG